MFICAGIQITVLSWIGFTKHAEMMNMWQITTHSYSLHRLNTNVLDLIWLGYNTTGAMYDQCWEQSVFWPCSCMVSVSIPHQHQSDPQSLVWSHTLRRGGQCQQSHKVNSTNTFQILAAAIYGLCKHQVTSKRCVDITGRHYACKLTERDQESSRLRASASLYVKRSVYTWATIIKDEETEGKASFRYVQVI